MEISMSKTVRNGADNQKSARENAGDKQKVPTPYPPVEPTVAQRKSEQKDR
jgi:hypothetical protein